MTIEQAAAKLRARELSSVELAEESLRRIREQQPVINAFITITEELALEQARRADEELARGMDRGPLHGIPYALKDLFETRGIRTTAGAKIFADYIPEKDCAVYRKLTAAGAVLMGKAGMHELAYGITNENPHFGPVRNPRDPSRIAGGSSGGSAAAVADDMVFFAIGTDTGGSIRIPAAFCGCVGLKPSFGRVNRTGVIPLSSSMDHIGPLTRTVRDAELVMQAISDFVPDTGRSITGCRIGVAENFFQDGLSPAVASAFEQALRAAAKCGARLVPVTLPDPQAINTVARVILLSEAAAFLEPWLDRRADFGADVLALLDQGRLISATDYVNAQRLRNIYKSRFSAVRENTDVVFTPTVGFEPPLSGNIAADVRLQVTRLVRPFNALGLPAVSIPLNISNFPIGLQIIGGRFRDAEVISIAGALGF